VGTLTTDNAHTFTVTVSKGAQRGRWGALDGAGRLVWVGGLRRLDCSMGT
jgi:hypothetical protein